MRIAWESQGEGAPVLLMHGLGYTREGWGPLRGLLAQRYRVLSYDNRGIGESEIPPGPYTVEELAADAVGVLDSALVERAHVIGASLGGFAAQVVASEWADRVDRLVLACTSPGGPGAFPLPEGTLRLMAEAPTLPPEVALRRFVENALAPGAPEPLVDEIFAYRQAHPPDPAGWAAQAAAGAAWNANGRASGSPRRRSSSPARPTRWSTRATRTCSQPGSPDARLEVVEGAGHVLFWERPEEFAALVEEHLG